MPLNDNDRSIQCEVPLPLVSVKSTKRDQEENFVTQDDPSICDEEALPLTSPRSRRADPAPSDPRDDSRSSVAPPILREGISVYETKATLSLPAGLWLSIGLLTTGIVLGGALVGFVMNKKNDPAVSEKKLAALQEKVAVLKENCSVAPHEESGTRYASLPPVAAAHVDNRPWADDEEVMLLPAPSVKSSNRKDAPPKDDDRTADDSQTTALPQIPSRAEVRQAMERVSRAVQACAKGDTGRITVKLEVDGASGRVVEAYALGRHAASQAGVCAQLAVKRAVFPKFLSETLTIKYPFDL